MWAFYLISLPLTMGMVILTLKYFAGPDIPRYVLFTVGYTWFCSLSFIILVPADIWAGTASVVLAGVVASLKLLGGSLADHTFLFLGAGEAGTGIAELIALEISTKTNIPIEETRKKIWLVDSKGLIVSSRKESLQHFKQPWAHEHEPIKTLLDAVKAIKPSVLIGTSGVGQQFTKDVVEALAAVNEETLGAGGD